MPAPILVALLHETLNREHFDTLADLVEALRANAARLRIPYDVDSITTAVAIVGRTRQLVHRRGRV